jgi:hypothetical protein
LTVNAVDLPTVAEPVPEPVLEKYATAIPATARTAITLSTPSVRFFLNTLRNTEQLLLWDSVNSWSEVAPRHHDPTQGIQNHRTFL